MNGDAGNRKKTSDGNYSSGQPLNVTKLKRKPLSKGWSRQLLKQVEESDCCNKLKQTTAETSWSWQPLSKQLLKQVVSNRYKYDARLNQAIAEASWSGQPLSKGWSRHLLNNKLVQGGSGQPLKYDAAAEVYGSPRGFVVRRRQANKFKYWTTS